MKKNTKIAIAVVVENSVMAPFVARKMWDDYWGANDAKKATATVNIEPSNVE